jgi:hypothetical protein
MVLALADGMAQFIARGPALLHALRRSTVGCRIADSRLSRDDSRAAARRRLSPAVH